MVRNYASQLYEGLSLPSWPFCTFVATIRRVTSKYMLLLTTSMLEFNAFFTILSL